MSRPRVLVVRSGANPFVALGPSDAIEIVEKVSHAIEPAHAPEAQGAQAGELAIFTSQVAVERVATDPLLGRLREAVRDSREIAAVGPATSEALAAHGMNTRIVAAGSADALLESLPKDMTGSRVLLPCGADASPELFDSLRRRGAHVDRFVVYRKIRHARDAGLEAEILERPFAAFCATSPSAAAWLFEGLAEAATARLRATAAVVLGRFTRRFLESHGVERIAMTAESRFDAALRLLEELATASAGA